MIQRIPYAEQSAAHYKRFHSFSTGLNDGAIETGEYTYDPARARGELDALGISDLELKIIWESGEFAADTDIMESVVQMFSAIGVRTTLQQFEPGGDIMIHGQPNQVPPGTRVPGDWTAGCIAVTDAQIEELFAHTAIGTEVEIRP